jgi:hypothetical protein
MHADGGLHNAVQSARDRLRKKLLLGTLWTATDGFNNVTCRGASPTGHLRSTEMSSAIRWGLFAIKGWIYANQHGQILWPAPHCAVPDVPKTSSFYEYSTWAQYFSISACRMQPSVSSSMSCSRVRRSSGAWLSGRTGADIPLAMRVVCTCIHNTLTYRLSFYAASI